ncbi:hypothetical protein M378DRAFT_185955 [Amanita muscaria Koide BX008]|uniref:Phosphatidylglycerol lysyltransferase C-terminal domain-containing protein n=1 Tax=Amanita muscaria (strain Koide BX008) TaxID=946122 RepID=A0A0C2WXZ1_AMAMK|nr:hypothetical protein M378DRAFT_185955 [Amanita muscaria Koide BX008]
MPTWMTSMTRATRHTTEPKIAELVATYGSSSSTAWLEFDRYHIWRADPIPESSFAPVQGYMVKGSYAFAWGNPIVSDPSALGPTARQFVAWVERNNLVLVWVCVDDDLQEILASEFGWSTVTCIYEDVIDPGHIIKMTGPGQKGVEGVHVVKDLKKNLRKAQDAAVEVDEMKEGEWTQTQKKEVEDGIAHWKKDRSGVQIASTTLQPWLDRRHRRYWLASRDEKAIGVLILTPIRGNDWQVKNAVSFPDAPKGTSEKLIFTALRDLHNEQVKKQHKDPDYQSGGQVTFGISAAKRLEATHNLTGWGIDALSKTYNAVTTAAGLQKRGEFRGKFDTSQVPKYVCYPRNGFGLDGAVALLKALTK